MMTAYDADMRTVIDLPPAQMEALAALCRRERVSRAEAIRRAVAAYLEVCAEEESEEAFGIWNSRGLDSLQYESRLREEWER